MHLDKVEELAKTDRWFEAMKVVRALYPLEASLMLAEKNRRAQETRQTAPRPAPRENFQYGPRLAVV